jgi:hypothetical protein
MDGDDVANVVKQVGRLYRCQISTFFVTSVFFV